MYFLKKEQIQAHIKKILEKVHNVFGVEIMKVFRMNLSNNNIQKFHISRYLSSSWLGKKIRKLGGYLRQAKIKYLLISKFLYFLP